MGIGRIVVRVQYLNLGAAQGEETGIPPTLARTLDFLGSPPFNVILSEAQFSFGLYGPRPPNHFHGSINQFPLHCRTVLGIFPLLERATVKKNNRIRGWHSAFFRGTVKARPDDGRDRGVRFRLFAVTEIEKEGEEQSKREEDSFHTSIPSHRNPSRLPKSDGLRQIFTSFETSVR